MQDIKNSKILVDPDTGEIFEESDRLKDIKNSKQIDWRLYKSKADKLANVYERVSISQESDHYKKRAIRVLGCGSELVYELFPNGEMKLKQVYFCKVRLCPMCSWRRSLKVFGQVSKVMDYMTEKTDYKYIFLTLTAKNVAGVVLKNELDKYFEAFNKLAQRKEFKALAKGFFRVLEITRNWTNDTYHPHFHVIIAVDKNYFKDTRCYLSQKRWAQLWQSCMGLDYEPIVDIRKVKPLSQDDSGEPFSMRYQKAVAEVAKYTVKSGDVVFELPEKEREKWGDEAVNHFEKEYETKTDETVIALDDALRNRRLVAFGGELKTAHKKLSLDDTVDGDLVNTDNEGITRSDLQGILVFYRWVVGLTDYFRT